MEINMTPGKVRDLPTTVESFFERHAWKVLLGISLIIGLFGLSDMLGGGSDLQNGEKVFMHSITGLSWSDLQAESPTVARFIDLKYRTDGATLAAIAILSIAVCLTGFRRGERWAWTVQWAIPVWMSMIVFFILIAPKMPDSGTPVPIISGSSLSLIYVLMLVLSSRKFFQSKHD
jgi:hypothetical protein